jgi:hypothetical protein
MIVAVLLLLVFVLDIATGFPLHLPPQKTFFEGLWLRLPEIGLIICSLALGFASWSTFRERT